MGSETSKHRERLLRWCQGDGLDLGSGGDPVVPGAISVDLPAREAERYTSTDFGEWPVQLHGDGRCLHWFRDGVLDYVYSSHLIEDVPQAEQPRVLAEWGRVVKPGGYLVLLYPEQERWAATVQAGQPCNTNHRHEPRAGELAGHLRELGWEIVRDGWATPGLMTAVGTPDYSWLVVARRPAP